MGTREEDRFSLVRTRTFSQVFDDLGRFVRSQWRPFLKVFAAIPGPIYLLLGGFNIYAGLLGPGASSTINGDSIGALIVILLLSITASLLGVGTTVAYLRDMEENRGEKRSISRIRKRVLKKIGPLLITFLAWVGILFVFSFGVGMGIGILSVMGAAAPPGLVAFIFFLAFLLVFPVLAHSIPVSFFAVIYHDLPFGKAFTKAWGALNIAFWRCWSVSFVAIVLLSLITGACMIPETLFYGAYAYLTLDQLMEGGSAYLYGALVFLRFLATQYFWAFFIVIQGLNYLSFHELRTGEELMERYDKLIAQK